MPSEEKKSIFIFCCIFLCILSKVAYNFYITKALLLTQFISKLKYVGIPLASMFVLMCLIVFTCFMFISIFYLYYLWQDVFKN